MNKSIVSILAAMAVALPMGLGLSGVAVAQEYDDCLNKRDIQQALENGEIAPLADVMDQAGISDRPLSVKVCQIDGSPHYVVNMMDSYGDSKSIVLNAQDGSQ